MAEENENKPKIRVIKKSRDDNSSADNNSSSNNSTSTAKVVVRKKVVVAAHPVEKNTEVKPKAESPKTAEKAEEKKTPAAVEKKAETPRSTTTFVLNPERPNSVQGNLKPRGNRPNGYQRGNGYRDRNNDGQNRDGNYGNRNYDRNGNRNGGGFNGNRAREDYQRNGNSANGRGGYGDRNRQGTFNRDGNNGGNRNFGGRPNGGNFNRDGQNRGPAGANRGSGGQNRPGFNPRSGGGFSSPLPMEDNKRASSKKPFVKKKTEYSKKNKEEEFDDSYFLQKKKQTVMANPVPSRIDIMENISVSDLAKKMNLKASDIIAKLFSMGMMVSITQSIDADTASLLASEYGCEVHIVSLYDETVIETEKDSEGDLLTRPPVVTVMGHVDHGKTKTLDAIRSAHVADSEFGGITQHIGAYMVDTPKGKITFLDTPGHEAFTMMRARGASITDIVVLVVAADDGVMPQTIEAINHAKDAKVPIVVAVNKIDKPEANPEKVMTQLSELGLMPEEWGGDTQFVKISAKQKLGIEDLLDAILLQAEILELKANWTCRAEGKVIESRTDHGRGVVSTIIVQRGTLKIGDPYVAGIYSGRVRAIFNDRGQKIKEASPSMPVEILGLESMPMAGDPFQVTDSEKTARAISTKRQELKRFEAAKAVKKVSLDNLYETIDAGEVTELKVVIKADVQGSAEALKSSLEKLSTRDIRLVVIHSSAGAINESDVLLAAADSNAIIVGFNVRPTPRAKLLADQEKVEIRKYNVIYKCVEEITQAMEGMLKPDVKEEVIGMVEVRDTFKVPKVGTIAGAYVTQGLVKRTSTVNVIRDGIVVHSGKIASLKRFKDDAKEVSAGYECGIGLADYQDIQVGDQFEIIEYVEVARKLGESLVEEAARKAEEEKK
ncbi:MAG: translation initiation factor IF-2 [Treponemataceae bacterium]|nr:translation initiation factor IF-2 [Treponemataceae bacterium]